MAVLMKVVTPPTAEPVTLTEAKQHLRVEDDFTDDDDYIEALISAAREFAEGFQRRSIAKKSYELSVKSFDSRTRLPLPPVASVTSFKIKNKDGTVTTLANTDYVLLSDDFSAFIERAPGFSYSGQLYEIYPVTIEYVAGYEPDRVPQKTKQAMLLLLGHWYANREAVAVGRTPTEVPLAAKSLLSMDRTW